PNGRVVATTATVTIRADGSVDLTLPQGRIPTGSDSAEIIPPDGKVTITLPDGSVITGTGTLKIRPDKGVDVTLPQGRVPRGSD
ncbi:MAG TPA: hypothetical protein VIH25_00870, partial [Steroidobacteraceae bacterium]